MLALVFLLNIVVFLHFRLTILSECFLRAFYVEFVLVQSAGNRWIIKGNKTFPHRRSMASLTKVTREEGVETITLSSPATRNALSLDMMLSVTEELHRCGMVVV